MKVCNTCQKELPEEKFDITPYGYRRHVCNSCFKEMLVTNWRRERRLYEAQKAKEREDANLCQFSIDLEQTAKL
jgi:hypothetical protein